MKTYVKALMETKKNQEKLMQFLKAFQDHSNTITEPVADCKLLTTVSFSQLPSWDVRRLNTAKYGPTWEALCKKVDHMIYRRRCSITVIIFLKSIAYCAPKKLKLHGHGEDMYGVIGYDWERHDEWIKTHPNDNKEFMVNVKQPKGHFRMGEKIYTLTQEEQEYLQQLFIS